MSLLESDFRIELAAHYSAVHARLWAGPRQAPPPPAAVEEWEPILDLPLPLPPPEPEQIAAKWREIDMRLFGGRVSPKAVLAVTAAYSNITIEELTRPGRAARFQKARWVATHVMHVLCTNALGPISVCQIARHLNRDHSSAFNALSQITNKINRDPSFATAIADIIDLLKR